MLNRKVVNFATHFKASGVFAPIPEYLRCDGIPYHNRIRAARFRLGSHNLEVERGRYNSTPWVLRSCRRCDEVFLDTLDCQVDDEYHMLFECEAFRHLRSAEIQALLDQSNGSIRTFVETGDISVVHNFISDCMKLVDDLVVLEPPSAG